MTKNISVVDTAKIIRQELKQKFPLTKFSVKTEKYSMGASINISWEDGYTQKEVEQVVDRFSRRGPSQVDDYVPYVKDIWEGQDVRWGSDYVNCRRFYSEQFQSDIEQIYISEIVPVLKKELPEFNQLSDLKTAYFRKLLNQKNAHNSKNYDLITFEIERNVVRAYPSTIIAKLENLDPNKSVSIVKVESIVIKPYTTVTGISDYWWNKEYLYNNQSYQLDDFREVMAQSNNVISFSGNKNSDLIIENVVLRGKIADFVRSEKLENESLEIICDRFFKNQA